MPNDVKFSATYSPEDNKLRLYAASRLPADLYARIKAAGYSWAPKQECFIAPMWTPARADLAEELAGEIGDEDSTLITRAEERAERFDGYSDSRSADAESARQAVAAIADNIPLGQPILIGHHSEKRARKDAERIQNGMRKAVKMWETARYWEERAAAAIRHAKYKERPDVRARRIKTLEAALRKVEKSKAEGLVDVKLWETLHDDATTLLRRKDGTTGTFYERALHLANAAYYSHSYPLDKYPRTRPEQSKYEGPMGLWSALGGDQGEAAAIITPEHAQRMVLNGARSAIAYNERWAAHYENRIVYERAMLAESGGTVADKKGPEKGGACRCWASPNGGWSYIKKVNKVSVTVLDNWGNGGADFTRTIPFDKLAAVMTAAEVQAARDCGTLVDVGPRGFILRGNGTDGEARRAMPDMTPAEKVEDKGADFDAMRETLRAGVQVVTAPQLFPTPRDLAQRAVDLADIRPGHRVLEPSAGTGALLGAMGGRMFGHYPERGAVVAVEIVPKLAERLAVEYPLTTVISADFLDFAGATDDAKFDRIVMNPPFADGADVKHIRHALKLLKPGGLLVAICANGPRQREHLQPLADSWEDLPPGTFKDAGTMVNAALVTITAKA